ncbi:MAG TPA: hypothetical protein VGR45_16435, partial [Stellaceae bacterium]|nr:hypothetical protein [Stellaceae bacterium]
EIDWLGRVASSLMALGLAALPLGMIVDWRLATKAARKPAKQRGKTPARRSSARQSRHPPRSRKPTLPKR